jgi:hypothetical protein
VDVAGGGRDESVITVVDIGETPYLIVEQAASANIDTVQLRANICETSKRYPDASVVVDHTGIGIGVSQALASDDGLKHVRLTFTSGTKAAWHGDDAVSVPREEMISNTVRLFESNDVRVPEEMSGMITALRTARLGNKRSGRYPDRLDSLMMALWIAVNTEPEPESWMGDHDFLAGLGIDMEEDE